LENTPETALIASDGKQGTLHTDVGDVPLQYLVESLVLKLKMRSGISIFHKYPG
jgi:hypothetical protein